MALNLKNKSRKDLTKIIADAEKQLKKLEAQEKKQALAAAVKAAKQHGFDLTEIVQTAKPVKRSAQRSKPKAPAKPKYAHPENPALTWSGRGRQPAWFKEAVAAGKKPEELAIKKG
ncbi:H-NS histone family protein [uncultured Roseobacter sp.]|uniref:H-NS histone family protein n=1 Tax=uncultured Roseobacter sp. TaxID=114847 RepID=UPI00261B19F7|nr:H-NS histone family protein [uncultured Roseobacter sp.]